MTKEKLWRLLDLMYEAGCRNGLSPVEKQQEYESLVREFEAWDPEVELRRLREANQRGRAEERQSI